MSDLIQTSLAEIRARLAGGDVTAEAVAKACLDRIAETEPSIHALITVREQALEEARALDAQGPDASKPLWGVPRHGPRTPSSPRARAPQPAPKSSAASIRFMTPLWSNA